jgi:hypothetical protein
MPLKPSGSGTDSEGILQERALSPSSTSAMLSDLARIAALEAWERLSASSTSAMRSDGGRGDRLDADAAPAHPKSRRAHVGRDRARSFVPQARGAHVRRPPGGTRDRRDRAYTVLAVSSVLLGTMCLLGVAAAEWKNFGASLTIIE